MNVLHQVNSLTIGGVETFVERLCKFSNENVFVFSHADGPVRQRLEGHGVPVYFKGPGCTMADVIRENSIDVVVMHTGSHYPDYAVETAKAFPGVKFIAVMHTICPGEPWPDAIVGISKAVCDVQVDKAKTHLIYPGIHRRREFVIGEVTRIAPYKYLSDIIQVADYLIKHRSKDFRFRIIGAEAADAKGYLEEVKKELVERGILEYFEFPGYTEKIPWHEFDAFVHLVGIREAFPVTLLEAANRHVPVYTSRGLGTEEVHEQCPLMIKLASDWQSIAEELDQLRRLRPKDVRDVADEFTKLYEGLKL